MPSRVFITLLALSIVCSPGIVSAGAFVPFSGVVTSDGIHIRTDSTVSSSIICDVNRGDPLEVYKELYEWYGVGLPRNAPSFIRKDLVQREANSTAQVTRDKVNVRLEPNESSAIIGKALKGEIVVIVADAGGWYKIEPVRHSTGWIHKQFVKKSDKKITAESEEQPQLSLEPKPVHTYVLPPEPKQMDVTIEGIVRPQGMFFQRKTTHKIVDNSGNVYLLRGDKETLNQFNNYRAKITGMLHTLPGYKYPLIEVKKIEYLE